MELHPATQILAWCLLVAALQVMAPGALLAVTALILSGAYATSSRKLAQLIRRTRWIMLSLLLIYAYSTPGKPLSDGLGIFSPSWEGLSDGAQQLARLLAALAGLAILLERLHRQHLIAGLYTLFVPLRWLGIPRGRVAVRLALTLHYAEVAVLRQKHDWKAAVKSLFEPHSEGAAPRTEDGRLELSLARFSAGDALLMGSALVVLWLAWR